MTEIPENIPELVDQLKADDRGRVNLGTDFANKTVRVVVTEVIEDNEVNDNE